MADDGASQQHQGLMRGRVLLLPRFQFAKLVQPGQTAFDEPTGLAETAAVCAALASRDFTPLFGGPDDEARSHKHVGPNVFGSMSWSTTFPHMRNLIDQRKQLRNIVTIRSCQDRCQRNALSIGQEMVFTARRAPIRGIWAGFSRPRKGTRTDELSTRCDTSRSGVLPAVPRATPQRSALPDSSSCHCRRWPAGLA